MIKRFIYWLYMKVIYLPALREQIQKTYPGVRFSCKIKDLDKGFVLTDETKVRLVQKAQYEREWIPDDQLH